MLKQANVLRASEGHMFESFSSFYYIQF